MLSAVRLMALVWFRWVFGDVDRVALLAREEGFSFDAVVMVCAHGVCGPVSVFGAAMTGIEEGLKENKSTTFPTIAGVVDVLKMTKP
jgi:hypothetical protein